MGNILIPAAVAGFVLVVFLLVFIKSTSGADDKRKKALLGQMVESRKEFDDSAENINILKSSALASDTWFAKIPGVVSTFNLLASAGMLEKRAIFFAVMLGLFILTATGLWGFGIISIVIAAAVAFFLPRKYLSFRINKRNDKFLDMFPDAVDLIVRSVRSGHPINTAMRMISENMESPVKDEFRQVTDEVSYGRTLPEALRRMSNRLNIPDVNFFVVVLSVQQETGGSLTEVLTNLSTIIRKRKQLRAKIHAMTSEGRATSYILGAIPVFEFTVLYFMTPSYLAPLFTTFNGNIMLGAAIMLIIASQVIIRHMINIEI